MTCKEICYQQWIDMYNEKDKECFDLQLKCSKLEQKLEKIKEILEIYYDDDWKATREIEKIIENEVDKKKARKDV